MPSPSVCPGPSPSKAKSVTPDPITSTPKSSRQQQRSRRRAQKPLVIFPSTPVHSGSNVPRDQCASAPAKAFMSRANSMTYQQATSTPKSRRQHYRSTCSGSPSFFAASKMTESPSATEIPLPPPTWLSRDAEEVSSICSDISGLSLSSGSSTESPTPDSCSVASDNSGFSASSSASFSFAGVRMDPMQLIAAVAAS